MATFKTGDRFRYIRKDTNWPTPDPSCVPIGAVGTIISPDNYGRDGYDVRFDLYRASHVSGNYFLSPWQMVPLTDPKADEFIERIKKMKPYDEPLFRDVERRAIEKIESVIGPLHIER